MLSELRFHRSLRFRVVTAFAVVGGVVSLTMALGLYVGGRDAGWRLIDETLHADMQVYLERRARNPHSLPPNAAVLRGYVMPWEQGMPVPPPAVAALGVGHHDIRLGDVDYRAWVVDHGGHRYALLYDETLLRDSQAKLKLYLALFVLIMTVISGALALWLAERVIEPVKALAQRVREIHPDARPPHLAAEFSRDEVGELAQAFEHTLARLAEFIERERSFTGDVSHELRTPIAIIRGAAEVLLAEEGRPEKDRARLRRIERAATDMADISAALLAMARERKDERREPVDVERVIEESIDKHHHLLGARPVELRVEVHARPRIAADPYLLAIVVANLLRNSFTYTERGHVRVVLDARELLIEDTGRGIARDALAKVFQRLYRGDNSEGAGIGLALVKKICERHGWQIDLASEEGKGTRVTLRFGS